MQTLWNKLWAAYANLCPDATKIHDLLEGLGERVVNDHIALRTFNLTGIGIAELARPFLELGYHGRDQFEFKEKHLLAQYFNRHHSPRIFISQLKVEDFSSNVQAICHRLAEEARAVFGDGGVILPARPWQPITQAEYALLAAQSDYAAWVAAFGLQANHFTVSINHLKKIKGIGDLNEHLSSAGFLLNQVGGEIKGSAAQLLEQSSTLARKVECEFADGPLAIPGCYYEFAQRFPDEKGKPFDGFLADSADSIFESTSDQGQD